MPKQLSTFTREWLARFGRVFRRVPNNVLISSIEIGGALGRIVAFPILLLFKNKRVIVSIMSMDACDLVESHVIEPSMKGKSVAPRYVFAEGAECYEIEFSAICYRKIPDSWVHAESSMVYSNKHVLIQPTYTSILDKIHYRNPFILRLTKSQAICAVGSTEDISCGIFVSGDGYFNWYHWLIEILPKAMLSGNLPEDLKEYPLLLPKKIFEIPTFEESLSIFTNMKNVILLDENIVYKVNRLIWVDSPVISPGAPKSGRWPETDDTRCHAGVLMKFRSRVLQGLKIDDTHAGNRKLFLARSHGRRSYNQAEVAVLMAEFGVETVYPEKLSFKEQVKLFNSASLIVGPSGAAWANMLFVAPSCHGLCWTFPEFSKLSVYSNIAALVGMDLSYIWTPVDAKSTRDLYIAKYEVDLVELRNAMSQIILKVGGSISMDRAAN